MKKLLIATTNPGKLREYKEFLKDLPLELVSLKDVGITDDVEETGKTYQENAEMKAKFYAAKSGLPALSDDGGIEIAALGGQPGLKSRRWLGDKTTDEDLVNHMIKVAKELPDDNRNARFILVVSLALPTGEVWSEEGTVDGIIAKEPLLKILKGYPYRSFFFLPQANKFYYESELTPTEMQKYNHRYRAVLRLIRIMKQELGIKEGGEFDE